MAVCWMKGYLSFILLSGIIFNSKGAKVQLFKDSDFKGEMLELNSSATCTSLPGTFKNLKGSIKSTDCMVVYKDQTCSRGVYDIYAGIHGDGYVVRLEEARLSELNHKYIPVKEQNFYVNSIKDCTEKETKSTVDFDYYEGRYFGEKLVQMEDICKCTNLPKSSFKNDDWRSANTYGNCFKIYRSSNCEDEPYFTTNVMWNSIFDNSFVSIEPCDFPRHCTRYTAMISSFVPLSISSKLPYSNRVWQVSLATNNESTTLDQNFEPLWETNETSKFEVPNELTHFESIYILGSSDIDVEADHPLFPDNSSTTLKSSIATSFQALRLSWNETILNGLQTKRELLANENISILPCTELKKFVEMTHVEIPYRVLFTLSGEMRDGGRLNAEAIRSAMKTFTYVNTTDAHTVLFETTIKLKLSYGSKTGVSENVTKVPMTECRRRFIKLAATVINFQPTPTFPEISSRIQRHAITTKTIILNNGTTQQEENYEATTKLKETARLQFPKEMSRMASLQFEEGLLPGIEISNPFISYAWTELQVGLSEAYQNSNNSQVVAVFRVQNENEYRVQRKIIVSPCTKYDVSPFVEMAENVEINYAVQVEITGELERETVGADEIRDILKDMTVLRNKDNFTVVAETTAKLVITYGVSSGVDASESPVLDCRSRFVKFTASIVNLQEVPMNRSTQSSRRFQVAPKLEFINNSTTQQEDLYEATKEITDSASLVFPTEIQIISLMKVDERVRSKLEKSIPFLDNVWARLKGGLSATRSNWNETISFDVQNTKEFRFQKQVFQAACMKYEVSSFIQMQEDVEINYRVLLEVTAKLGLEPVTADEIRGNLKQLTSLDNKKDDFTSIVVTTMKLKLNYRESSGVDAAGTQMLDCLEIQAALVANCKFTCGA